MEYEIDFSSVAGCNEALVNLSDDFNGINDSLDSIENALVATKSLRKCRKLLEEYYDVRCKEIESRAMWRRLRAAKSRLLRED
jgi:uncharacterized protein with NRDE domain